MCQLLHHIMVICYYFFTYSIFTKPCKAMKNYSKTGVNPIYENDSKAVSGWNTKIWSKIPRAYDIFVLINSLVTSSNMDGWLFYSILCNLTKSLFNKTLTQPPKLIQLMINRLMKTIFKKSFSGFSLCHLIGVRRLRRAKSAHWLMVDKLCLLVESDVTCRIQCLPSCVTALGLSETPKTGDIVYTGNTGWHYSQIL